MKAYFLIMTLIIYNRTFADSNIRKVYRISAGGSYLSLEIPLVNGLPNGKVVSFHNKSGHVFAEQHYVDGVKNGEGFVQWDISEGKTRKLVKFQYSKGYLNGDVTTEGRVLHQFENGFPKDWKNIYKNPFAIISKNQKSSSPRGLHLKCGFDAYSELSGDYHADSLELADKDGKLTAVRCFSEGGGCEDQLFSANHNDVVDSDQFLTYKFSPDNGELKLRLIETNKKVSVQAYGYILKNSKAVTKDDMRKNDSELEEMFSLRYDYDTELRYGLDKIELNCKTVKK